MIHRRHHRFHHYHFRRFLETPQHRLRRHLSWGGILIAFGAAVLLHGQALISAREIWLAAPVALVWSGLVRIAVDRDATAFVRALIRFAVAAGLVVVIEQVGGWTFATAWPVLLIAFGLATLARAIWPRVPYDGGACEEPTW